MKKWIGYLLVAFCGMGTALGQKGVIDTTVIRGWPSLYGGELSGDGMYAMYVVISDWEPSTLVVTSTHPGGWRVTIPGGWGGRFTADGRQVIYSLPGDSLCIRALGGTGVEYITHAGRFQLSEGAASLWLAYQQTTGSQELVLRDLASGAERRYAGVVRYLLCRDGQSLVIEQVDSVDSGHVHTLAWLDMRAAGGAPREIWRGGQTGSLVFNVGHDGLAFFSYKVLRGPVSGLWYYNRSMDRARELVSGTNSGSDSAFEIGGREPVFSRDGGYIFFNWRERVVTQRPAGSVAVDVWGYRDWMLQSEQLQFVGPQEYAAAVIVQDGRVLRLHGDHEGLLLDEYNTEYNDTLKLVATAHGEPLEWWWNANSRPTLYLVSGKHGRRQLLKADAIIDSHDFVPSPGGRWFVYYDHAQEAYMSYDRTDGRTRNLTGPMPVNFWLEEHEGFSGERVPGLLGPFLQPVEIGGWVEGDRGILLQDGYDIWRVDPSGEHKPVNLTNGYGRTHHIRLRVAGSWDGRTGGIYAEQAVLLLSAFDEQSKYHGFYRQCVNRTGDPERLSMGPWHYGEPDRAKESPEWLLTRMSAMDYPNDYVTTDFKTFTAVSDLAPQRAVNWLTAELVHWQGGDGKTLSGIVYKPENFDAGKRYPVIFTYYESRSQELFDFLQAGVTGGAINIPWFVSRGYVVMVPDIRFRIGDPGASALNCVESAARYASKQPWADSQRMGIDGVSFGGYETNYLVTHSHLFAAAAEVSGATDFISGYGGLMFGYGGLGSSRQFQYETAQSRIGATLWQQPDLYIRNSPVMQADQVTTPLLMMHNMHDGSVPFTQAVELYTALRRLGKRVWLLQYDDGGHIVGGQNALDYTIRLTQFFDHYLKVVLAPTWMTEGIPARLKGLKKGYELDERGREP